MVHSQGGQGSKVHLTHALPDPGPESPGPRLGTGSVQPPLTSDTPTGCVITQAMPSSWGLAGGEEELGARQAPGGAGVGQTWVTVFGPGGWGS